MLLTAAEPGLATSPMTDLAEVADTRLTVRRLLHRQSHPYAVLRVGVAAADHGVPAVHPQTHDEAIDRKETSS